MVLVDTSVWVDHFRRGDEGLVRRLHADEVVMHPAVLGELAGGNLRNRAATLALLADLRPLPPAADAEVMHLLEVQRLHGRGLGWIDLHLLAACRVGGAALWTKDAALAAAARELGVAPPP